jgi:hypothetical protein
MPTSLTIRRYRVPNFGLTKPLRDVGARHVEARDTVIERRVDDLPFAKLTPNPWLGREKLGTI